MKEEFLVFRKSIHSDIVKEISAILTENDIENYISDDAKIFDPSFANNEVKNEFVVKIKQTDFEKGNTILTDYYTNSVEIPEDYYLKDFSNEDLKEILFHKDDWNEIDVVIARKILEEERKVYISEEQIKIENEEYLDHLKTNYENPKKVESLLIFGYFFAIFGALLSIFHWICILISYIIGILILTLRKQLPNGERIHFFKESERKHGLYIIVLSIALTVFWLIVFSRRTWI